MVEQAVNLMARGRTERLGLFRRIVRSEKRFLYDYEHPERLLYRLNQVMRRVPALTAERVDGRRT